MIAPSTGLTTTEAIELLTVYGPNTLLSEKTPSWRVFLKHLYKPMQIITWAAIIMEFSLQNWSSACTLLIIQLTNVVVGYYEDFNARNITNTHKTNIKPMATVKRDGAWTTIHSSLLVPGDLIKLNTGSTVLADCTINEGDINVDESTITGESLPVTMHTSDMPKMGSVVVHGEAQATVQFTGSNTFLGKTKLFIPQNKTKFDTIYCILSKIALVLTLISIVLCLILIIYLVIFIKIPFRGIMKFIAVLFVVSIPITIEMVTNSILVIGSKELALKGIMAIRLSSIEAMARTNIICTNKMNILTLNSMEMQDYCPIFTEKDTRYTTLIYAALATKWRELPMHPIDIMILETADLNECNRYTQIKFTPFDSSIKRTEAIVKGPDGVQFKVTKGAPDVVLRLCANKLEIQTEINTIVENYASRGIRCLGVARTFMDDDGWIMVGILTFLNLPRYDTKLAVQRSMQRGIDIKMVTGDNLFTALDIASAVGMGTNTLTPEHLPTLSDIYNTNFTALCKRYSDTILESNVCAQVSPESKYFIIKVLQHNKYSCIGIGNSVDDVPVIKQATVGITTQGATDAVKSVADILVTKPGLFTLLDAVMISRGVFHRIEAFICYRITATLHLLLLFFIASFLFPPTRYGIQDSIDGVHSEFFHIPVLMFMAMTLLNDGALLCIGYDNAILSNSPKKWNLKVLFCVATIMASIESISSLLLLWMSLDGNVEHAYSTNCIWVRTLGLQRLHYSQIITMMYLKISISDTLTLFSTRTRHLPFWYVAPNKLLLLMTVLLLLVSTVIAALWPPSYPDGIKITGLIRGNYPQEYLITIFVWLWCVAWWWIQDICKVITFNILDKYHIFGEYEEPTEKADFVENIQGHVFSA